MLSQPFLPGDGNNWRQNCFGDFLLLFKRWRNEDFGTFAFVVPRGVTSDMRLLTGEIVVLFHVLSDVDTETFYSVPSHGTRTTHMGKITPYPSINVTLQQLKTEQKYLHLFQQPFLKIGFPECVHFS